MKIIFLNHTQQQCGVYQYGLRLCNILSNCKINKYIYKEINNHKEYLNVINENEDINYVIYNCCDLTMPWLNNNTINVINKIFKKIGIIHPDWTKNLGKKIMFDIKIDFNTNNFDELKLNKFVVPRPIIEVNDIFLKKKIENIDFLNFINDFKDKNIPIFGSFGLAGKSKNWDIMIKNINDQFDEAIIKILMPSGDFCKKDTFLKNELLNIKRKRNIKLLIYDNFIKDEELIIFLNSCDFNIILQQGDEKLFDTKNTGISSTIDFFISAQKPFCISKISNFQHVYIEDMNLKKYNLNQMIKSEKLKEHVIELYKKNSNANLINKFNEIFSFSN